MPRTSDAPERLVEAAKHLFYSHGYNAVGVKEICDQAGVNKGSFYHFFPSKRDLLIAVIDAQAEWLIELMQEAARPEFSATERIRRLFTLLGRFDDTVRERVGHVVGCPFGNLAAELAAQDEEIRVKIEGVFAAGIDFIEGQLHEAVEVGEVQGVDPAEAAQAILAYLEGVHLLAATRDAPGLLEELADGALRLAGVRPVDADGIGAGIEGDGGEGGAA